jgi:hypothetical protein
MENASRRLLLGFVLPLWTFAGAADWWCHRRSEIERTAGTHESIVHSLMMAESSLPLLSALFLEVNAGVLSIALASLALHQVTATWDVAYAEGRREVTATEQHVHGLLEQVPVMATGLLVALHWDQARSLLPAGSERPDFSLQAKRKPLSRNGILGVLAAILAFGVVPYAQEIIRCQSVQVQSGAKQADSPS